jgi:type II secretory pathway component PulF
VNLTYEAIDAAGRTVSDSIQADSVKNAVEQLRQRGMMVTSIEPVSEVKIKERSGELNEGLSDVKLPLKQLVLFTRQMAMLLASGSALVPALGAIARQLKKPGHAGLVHRLRDDLEQGATLAEALCRFPRTFEPTYCAVIAAGESSATLPEMFDRLAGIVAKRRTLRNKVLGAMAYPALLMVLCGAQVAILLFFVLPRFGEMFASLGAPLPSSTKIMLAISDALLSYWPVLALGAGGVAATLTFMISTISGRQWSANMQTRAPFIGRLFSGLIQGQIFRTLGMLIEARVSVLESLELARRATTNNRFQDLFDRIENAVTGGGSFSDTMEASGLIDPAVCQAVRTGEESGNLGGAMSYAADVLDEDNTELVHTVTRLLEPVIIILMGLIVGAVAISLFMPLFDITSMTQ